MTEQVRCTRCNETKPGNDFIPSHVRMNRRGDRTGLCRPCSAEYHREFRHRKDRSGRCKIETIDIACAICKKTKSAIEYRWNSRTGYRTECQQCERKWLRCSECKTVKRHAEFPPSKKMKTGRHSVCNDCHNERCKAKYHGDPEVRKRHKACSRGERAKAWRKQYWKKAKGDPNRKASRREYMKWLYHSNPVHRLKVKARSLVCEALKKSRLVRPTCCENCGEASSELEGHHYAGYWPRVTWLMVRWLCHQCHIAADMAQPSGKLFVGFGLPELADMEAKMRNVSSTLGLDQSGILQATTECLGEDEHHVFLNSIEWLCSHGYKITKRKP